MVSPGNHVWSLGSKAHMEPSGKLVCRGPIQCQDIGVVQNPQARGISFLEKGRAMRNVAFFPSPGRTVLSVSSHNPSA